MGECMSRFSFPYDALYDPETGRTHYRPVARVTLIGPHNRLTVDALVDSGSDASFLPPDLADYLGCERGAATYPLEGVLSTEYAHQVQLQIQLRQKQQRVMLHSVPFAVLPKKSIDEIILGREVFFDQFLIKFHGTQKRLTLQKLRP